MDLLYMPNDTAPLLSFTDKREALLKQALKYIVVNYPPRNAYPTAALRGLCAGPTAIAYLFLQVSATNPDLRIAGHSARHWAKGYISGSQGHIRITPGGLFSEKLAFAAVGAAITRDLDDVKKFVRYISGVLDGGYPNELLYGYAGVLYMLRLIRQWVPNSTALVENAIEVVSEKIMTSAPNWTWHGKRYIGAAHGDVGIITQLVLTTPSMAPRLEDALERLLSRQKPNGNWTSRMDGGSKPLVQWCHGGPGFVLSLLSLRPFFPRLQYKIDTAVETARELVWREGLLRKEPCLCHGILGNALVFPPGQRRDHFLAMATPSRVAELREKDGTVLFQPAESGDRFSIMMDYWPSAAWTWLVCENGSPKMILYNDV